jgi:alkanesulfonate monooxygenase SsuD/methylene tetrahydromethanopterin reductase-like flavin-dependent oxidoreductase (luciferase family)
MPEPRFGVRIPVAGVLASGPAFRRAAVTAERLGFDSVWVHDYIIWTKELDRLHISCGSREAVDAAGEEYPPIFYESITNMAFLAAATERIRLGIAVLCLPYRDPVVTAKQLACVDQLSGGRLELGIGPGAPKSTLNVDPEVLRVSRKDKFAKTRSYFEAMRKIWTEDEPSVTDGFVDFGPASVFPKTAQSPYPPIWVGGSAAKSLDILADFGTGWLPNWITPDDYPAAIRTVHDLMIERGRDPSELTVGTEIQIGLAETPEAARAMVGRTMGAFEEGYAGTTGGVEGERDAGSSDTMNEIWRSSLVGSTASVTEEIQRYVDSGCTFFELKFIYHTLDHLEEQLQMFAEEIAPHVSGSAG